MSRRQGIGMSRRLSLRTGLPRWGRRSIYVWLALLTACAVFAATAGAREALSSRTQALRQTLATASLLAKTISVETSWAGVSEALFSVSHSASQRLSFAETQLAEITGQLHDTYNRGVVSLAPASTDWASMTSQLNEVQTALPATHGVSVRLEVSYRQPLSKNLRLVTGRLPAPPSPASHPAPSSASTGGNIARQLPFFPALQVLVSTQTAARFGLRVGSKVQIPASRLALNGKGAPITLQVSGIVAPINPASSFWTADPTVDTPDLLQTPKNVYWVGGVIAGPGAATAMEADFGLANLELQWMFPLTLGSLQGQQAQPLSNALTSLSAQSPQLSGDVAPVSPTLTASSDLLTPLRAFLAAAEAVDSLLWLLYVSLIVAGVAVLVLAARMVALRRSAELTLVRARGASLRQLAVETGGDAALVCVPAAAVAAGLGILVIPGADSAQGTGSAGAWWPPAIVLAVAVFGPALFAAWQHRLPGRRALRQRRPRGRIRLVAEVTLVAAAVAGIVVFRQQGAQAGAGVNLFTSAVPVLVAIPAVIVVLRLYPLVLRGLLRASARSSSAPAFLGLARAARTTLTPALPAFALVLALTVAAFAGMVRDAVSSSEIAASWQAAGADATITASPLSTPDSTIPAAALRSLAAIPGVTHAAQVWQAIWGTSGDTQVTVLVVDPADYAALVNATAGYSPIPAGLLAATTAPGATQPVLASPEAAADLGRNTVTLSTQAAVQPVHVRVAGMLASTPALPRGGAFVVMPLTVIKSTATPPLPAPANEVLLTGANIDRTRLSTVLKDVLPGAFATFRSDVLTGLTAAPLQHGAFTLFALAVVVAAVLGLAVMLLEFALGAAEREAALARLAVMGLGEGQRARMVALEVLPVVIAAAVAAWGSALVLPQVVAPAIDLSVFTGSSAATPLVPDIASVALPLIGLAVLAAVSLGIEIRSLRRGAGASLRVGG
jgi:putative ABC transport system permease protein